MNAEEIHRELGASVYDQNIMSEGALRQRRRMLNYGRKEGLMMKEVAGHLQ
jgi:hypothetical protein